MHRSILQQGYAVIETALLRRLAIARAQQVLPWQLFSCDGKCVGDLHLEYSFSVGCLLAS